MHGDGDADEELKAAKEQAEKANAKMTKLAEAVNEVSGAIYHTPCLRPTLDDTRTDTNNPTRITNHHQIRTPSSRRCGSRTPCSTTSGGGRGPRGSS